MSVLKLTLHLDEHGLATGGGWCYENPPGSVVAAAAFPAWPEPLVADTGTDFLIQDWLDNCGHQLAF
jgi:hypothetical protein